ncbi:MAG: ERCC4 domain-containing protein [Candidatus Pacearchaeota archaeon]|jgi:Fanconi anemia group M protein
MPLFNPFSFKKRKTSKPKILPRIIADIHEKDSMILAELSEKQNNQEIELIIQSLKIGDYLIGKTVIERKTVSDFISSMLSKRLVEQLKQMKQYPLQLLIIEGIDEQELYKTDTKLNPNSIRGFILSIITNYQIPIIFTQNYKDTSNYLITLAKQQLKPKQEISLHSRIPLTLKEQKQYILEAFPNIGPVKAKKLLEEFKTLSNIFNASEEELTKVLRKKSLDFKQILNK